MKRITLRGLDSRVDAINTVRGVKYGESGFLEIGAAYGGYCLNEFTPTGMRTVSRDGYGTARELNEFINTMTGVKKHANTIF